MPLPDEPVEERIIADLCATLRTIVAGADYYHTLRDVKEFAGSPLENLIHPCAIVYYDRTDESYGSQEQSNRDLFLKIVLAVDNTPDQRKQMSRLIADVRKALRRETDINGIGGTGRGYLGDPVNANAFDTYIEKCTIANEADGFPCGVGQVDVRVQYRDLYTDPTVAI